MYKQKYNAYLCLKFTIYLKVFFFRWDIKKRLENLVVLHLCQDQLLHLTFLSQNILLIINNSIKFVNPLVDFSKTSLLRLSIRKHICILPMDYIAQK